MRLDKLYIKKFKNLDDFYVDFDETQMTTVLIGKNGTGKSNLIEALVIIFRDLDLGKDPFFSYSLNYECNGFRIKIIADTENKPHYSITVDKKEISFPKFLNNITDEGRCKYLPRYVFAYYSGPSNRLETLFDKHQNKFRIDLLGGNNRPLRPLFYARLIHSQFVLLSYFSFEDTETMEFLEKYLGIVGLESVLFVLKKPSWNSKEGDKRFWNARGVVSDFLNDLYKYSLAPIRDIVSVSKEYGKSQREERLYLFIQNEKKLQDLAQLYFNNREFFKALESTYISDLISETKIRVKISKKSKSGEDVKLTFKELSEGEQQLLTVLGLLKFTRDDESLFLLDEPDTHLNPAWKLEYLDLLKKVVGENEKSHVIISTHDPLVIGGLIKSQVQIFYRDQETKQIHTTTPSIDPKGMGVAALLTSELFGLSSTLDPETQGKLDRKRELFLKTNRTPKEEKEMNDLTDELGSLDFTRTIRDPLYDKFVREAMKRDEFKRPVLTPDEFKEQERISKEIIDKILKERDA